MKSSLASNSVHEILDRLAGRVRWKRWLKHMRLLVCVTLAALVMLFLADLVFGMRTLSLRIASLTILVCVGTAILATCLRAFTSRLDPVGLAQLLEKRYPELAERLLTVAQFDVAGPRTGLAEMLEDQTARQLSGIDLAEACPLQKEGRRWAALGTAVVVVLAGLAFVPGFGSFTYRFAHAWGTPLAPFAIHAHYAGFALRGASVPVQASIQMIDERATPPDECELVCEYESGLVAKMPMTPSVDGFATVLADLRQPLNCHIVADGITSEAFAIQVVEVPALVGRPSLEVTPPGYMKNEIADQKENRFLCFSKLRLGFTLDRRPIEASLRVTLLPATNKDSATTWSFPVQWHKETPQGQTDWLAKERGKYRADLVMKLERGLSATLPLEQWSIHDDGPPRFVEPLRLHGQDTVLDGGREHRIAVDDLLRLQTAVADDEGLGAILFEYRINGGPARTVAWLHGGGRREFAINHWLPLPSGLKTDDRVQFRIHAFDNRQLKKAELDQNVPDRDLPPQVVIAPAGDAEAWVTLRVDAAVGSFVKKQIQVQASDVNDIISKIKKKLQSEIEQVQQVQRTVHLQTALAPAQAKQAEKIQKLNAEIVADLNRAGDHFLTNPALAILAGHFFDIADVDMKKSEEALARFMDRDRPLPEAEKELPIVHDSLMQALKKLDRMGDWNKLLAQDRLDQFTLEKLQKRQEMLAQKLENAQQQPLSDAELAKEIEAIRNEQAKLAAETAQLQEKSKLVQESLAALEQTRMERLAQEAERLAAEQRGLSELDPEKMPAEIKDRLAALTKRQADLGKRVQPFAREQKGPQLAPASDAADALGKSRVPEAIAAQKEHEKRLGAWLGQLLPGGAVNKLREQVQQLAKTQRAIRADLEKLGQDLGGLNDKMIADRLSALVKKQRDLHAGVAGLPIDKKTQPLAEQKDSAAATAKTAADQLAAKDALSAFESMEKSEKQLQALAASMPQSLPVDRKEIKDAGERAKIEQIERFEKEQLLLRQETERLLADWLKSSAGAKNPLAEKLEKLAGGLMELSQKGSSPEAKSMAKESMQMIDDAKKAMELSQAMKAKGEGTEAKKLDDDAAGRLEMAFKQLDKMTQGKNPPKDGDGKTAESLEQSRAEMNKAKASLPKMPKDAQVAMKAAAKSLAEAASQASKQSKNRLPNPPARNPAARAPLAGKGANSSAILKNVKLDESIGKAWGEMPGELKTQMLQDFRARFGEDYAEMIRQYFDRLAEISAKNRQR